MTVIDKDVDILVDYYTVTVCQAGRGLAPRTS